MLAVGVRNVVYSSYPSSLFIFSESEHFLCVEAYPAVYRDRFGEVATILFNDGKELRMKLRGVEFTGRMLDDWEPGAHADAARLPSFTRMER